jgi:hypothetical protein
MAEPNVKPTPDKPPHQHELPDGRKVALGRPAVKDDHRSLKLARYLIRVALPEPPLNLNLSHYLGATPWGMYDNDKWGNCTAAGVAHEVMLDAAMLGQSNVPKLAEVMNLYAGVTGAEGAEFDLATGKNDNGAIELDVLNYWRRNAMSGVQLEAFVSVQQSDLTQVRTAMMLLGGLYIGLNLPRSAQSQVGQVWDVVPGKDSSPGSWGGHCVTAVDFDWSASTHTISCVTWGGLQVMTEAFWAKYVDEAWGTLTSAWKLRAPQDQFNFALLEADLAQFGKPQ